ncbi:MAG TPA: rhamnulokinase family protein, partial [Fimbriimonas sp.]|nr:rhamnulokinase family protein [Fimbriimonas sp.]
MSARRVAIDLGASSGRVAVGQVVDARLEFEIVHRFSNGPAETPEGLKWDWDHLLSNIEKGLILAGQGGPIASIGVDSWAVDYGVVSPSGEVICTPYCYRDSRTDGVLEALSSSEKELFWSETGLQFLPFNTVFQLRSHVLNHPEHFAAGNQVLLVPDLLHFWLTGVRTMELTNASTTQLLNPASGDWSDAMLSQIPLDRSYFPPLIEAGTRIGKLLPRFSKHAGLEDTEVIAPATHDTGSAVLAIPLEDTNASAYISSGTWSLVGLELPSPVITPEAAEANFSNEGGAFGTTRFLKNVMGLWILQECMRAWGESDASILVAEAANVIDFAKEFDPDLIEFLHPGTDMPQRVSNHTGVEPENRALIVASILTSLAGKTASVLALAQQIANIEVESINISGGGSQNDLLNQLIASKTGKRVIAGPV